ncbi:hypothetical protein [Sphingomonas melonis]|uniref:hypothetical protein n=1 Tax=Sphingomonas melonis TaxID=152682 RepID=UPI000362EAFF|nr:hypothetical protein [Sphingomonas melonis]
MERILLAGLMKAELPGHTILLCDGGFVPWAGDIYMSADETFGTIDRFEPPEEGVGDIVPGGTLTMLPNGSSSAIALSRPDFQGSRIRFWVAEIVESTGQVVGEPDLQADWQLDRTTLRSKRGAKTLDVDMVSRAQRLLAKVEGVVLSSASHSSIFPGERGFDNGIGLSPDFAWGVASPPRGVVASGTVG